MQIGSHINELKENNQTMIFYQMLKKCFIDFNMHSYFKRNLKEGKKLQKQKQKLKKGKKRKQKHRNF